MKKRITNVIWGLCLVLFGIGIAGNVIGIWDFQIFFDGWWTLFIIIPCTAELLSGNTEKSSLIGLVVGILLLMASRGVITFGDFWRSLFPVVLILAGVHMVWSYLNCKVYTRVILAWMTIAVCLGLTVVWTADGAGELQEEAISQEMVEEEFSAEEIHSLFVAGREMQVTIVSEPGALFRVEAFNPTEEFEISAENGVLTIKQSKKDFFENLFEESGQTKLKIIVPEDSLFEQLELSSGSGTLTAEGLKAKVFSYTGGSGTTNFRGLEVLEQAELVTGSGTAVFENTNLNNVKITSGSGTLSFGGNLTGICRLTSGSGTTTYALLGNLADYTIEGKGGSGNVWINGEKYSSLNLQGNIDDYRIQIRGGSGRIVIDFGGALNREKTETVVE